MQKLVTSTSDAPSAIGTYSQAIRVGQTVYLSGQIPLNPQTAELISGDLHAEVRQVFANLAAVAKASNGSLNDVVKLGVFLTDLSHFSVLNEIMQELFTAPFPARSTIQVSALPRGARVEVDAVMVIGCEV